ncbi:MAG: NADH-quinone oxidoreductase subunit J [Candidatus Lernaella stagnicola]|nr:NADH-quinone oxidoreductase subunit J [Candidatus Lernaella stagnicola]
MLKAIYLLFALGAVTGAANVVSRRNPVNVAISLLFTFLCVASLYILHGSPLLAMIQIIVYAGAILILVVFTIMLLSLREPGTGLDDFWTRPQKLAAAAAATILGGQLVYIAYQALDQATPGSGADLRELAAPATLAHVLFDKYLLPFEVASVLLLLAIVGTVVLTRRPKGTAAAIDADHADEIAPPEGGDS